MGTVSFQRKTSPSQLTDRWEEDPLRDAMRSDQGSHQHRGAPMLPVRTWILNAAAALSGHHGAVTLQAQDSGCSRETVYQHSRKLEQRLAAEPGTEAALAELRAEARQLRQRIAELKRGHGDRRGATG